jgi:hypothetical protein
MVTGSQDPEQWKFFKSNIGEYLKNAGEISPDTGKKTPAF